MASPRGLSRLDPLPLAPLPLLYAMDDSPGSGDSDQDSWVGSGLGILAAQQRCHAWEHIRAKRILTWTSGQVFGREQWGPCGKEG